MVMKVERIIFPMHAAPEPGIKSTLRQPPPRLSRWLAAGALVGAGLSSACCVVPLVLLTLGISGAWIGNLTALEPYKPYVAAITLIVLGYGFWHVYVRSRTPCEEGTYCARPQSRHLTKAALWLGLALVIIALTLNWWAPLFY